MILQKTRLALFMTALFIVPKYSQAYYCVTPTDVWQSGFASHLNDHMQSTTKGLTPNFYNYLENQVRIKIDDKLVHLQNRVLKQVDDQTENQANSINKMQNEIMTALKNYGQGRINSDTAIAEFEHEKQIESYLYRVRSQLEQPSTNCLTLSTSDQIKDLKAAHIPLTNQRVLQDVDTALLTKERYKTLNARYYSIKNTYIDVPDDNENKDADINAAFLFGNKEGGESLNKHEAKAANQVIQYIVGKDYIPTALTLLTKTDNSSTRQYDALVRRYITHLALASQSLNSVLENHITSPVTSNVSNQQHKTETSTSEILNQYADQMIGSDVLEDIASQRSQPAILRVWAQNTNMRLLVSKKMMESNERILAMEAAKLSLLREKILTKQIISKRQDSINSLENYADHNIQGETETLKQEATRIRDEKLSGQNKAYQGGDK